MRRLLAAAGIFVVVVLIGIISLGIWLYFYTADLPSTAELVAFNPAFPTKARLQTCGAVEQEIAVVPKGELGRYTVAAVTAAEGKPERRSPFLSLFAALLFRQADPHVSIYQVQLARTIACTQPHRSNLKRELQEIRLANAINREFGGEELLTIYLNRAYFGFEAYGVESGARRYFGKPASQLTLDETALLLGMIRAPSLYSPIAHPDRAAKRRSSILDEMVAQGSVTRNDADAANAMPIHVVR